MSRASESIAFANQYRRELTRLEKYHANNIAPGTTRWSEAISVVFDRMGVVGSPIKQSAILKSLSSYINEIKPEEKTAFVLAHYNSKRVAALAYATIKFGGHPLAGPNEQGVRVTKTLVTVKRDGVSEISSTPLVYISQHAIERMHERRARPLSTDRATYLISGVGMLGAMICFDACGHDAMCLNLEDEVLAVGDIRHVVGPENDGGLRQYTAMLDVRSFLCVGELASWDRRLAQGNAALAAVNEWVNSGEDSEVCMKMIPVLAQERETYTAQTARKLTEDCE